MQFAQILKQLSGEFCIHQRFKNHSRKLCKLPSRSKIKPASQMTLSFAPKLMYPRFSSARSTTVPAKHWWQHY